MSTKSKTAPATPNGNGAVKGPPDGYRQASSSGNAPWAVIDQDKVIHGKLVGMFTINSEPPRNFFQLKLLEAAAATTGKGKDKREVEVPAGGLINLNDAFKVREPLMKLLPEHAAGAEFNVYVKVKEKIDVSGGRTMWDMDVFTKMTSPPKGPVTRNVGTASDTSDVPF